MNMNFRQLFFSDIFTAIFYLSTTMAHNVFFYEFSQNPQNLRVTLVDQDGMMSG
jgi:hypothetical protein